ncbi:MAG: hypothetical protein ACJ74L_08750 [Gaiellaceae bacterium]
MTVATAPPAREPAARTFADRLLAAVPLLSIFLWLCIVYAVEAWAHSTPWLFGDELELSQLSRAVAKTGHAARRGEPHSFDTLWTYVLAPAWHIYDAHTAYATVKYIAVLTMTATAFPAYALARLVVGRVPALFVATASCVIPALAYSSMIVEEPLAYPYSTLCLYLIARMLVRPSRWWIAGTIVAVAIAPLVRGELAVMWPILGLSLVSAAWRAEPARRWRTSWSKADWAGLVVLALGVAIVVSAALGKASLEWFISTDLYKGRLFDLGLNAAGALTIGLGVLPVVAGLASLWSPVSAVFRSVFVASIISFGVYTAVKSTYVSTTFGTYTYERNLIYLAPLLFIGTAVWLETRRVHALALGLASAFVLYLLLTTPYEMGQDFSYNAPGLAILQQANRYLRLDATGAKLGLVALLAFSVLLLAAPHFLRRGAVVLTAAVAAGVIVWNFTGQLSFASASNRASDVFVDNIRRPFTWVDDATGGKPALYIGQQMYPDQNGEWLLEFWNPHSLIGPVWSLDGTAQGPGPTLTPDPTLPDGALSHDPGYPYVVEEGGMDVVGKVVATHEHVAGGSLQKWRLVRVAPPLRLRSFVTGLYADGWSGPSSAYTHFAQETTPAKGGRVRVVVSRREWGGPDKYGNVTVKVGPVVIGDDIQPHVGEPAVVKRFQIHTKQEKRVTLPIPGPTFRVEVTVAPTFRPSELSPQTTSDARELGAKIAYAYLPPRKAAHK